MFERKLKNRYHLVFTVFQGAFIVNIKGRPWHAVDEAHEV